MDVLNASFSENITAGTTQDAQVELEVSSSGTEVLGPTYQIYLVTLYSLTASFAFISNLITLIVLIKGKRSPKDLRKFLINLCCADVLMATFTIPFTYTNYMLGKWIFWPIMCPIVNAAQLTTITVSVYTLVAIAIDRYFAVMHPLQKSKFWFKQHRSVIVCLVWALGVSMGASQIYISETVTFEDAQGEQYLYCTERWNPDMMESQVYTIFIFLTTFGLPMVTLCCIYSAMGWRLFKYRMPGSSANGLSHSSSSVGTQVAIPRVGSYSVNGDAKNWGRLDVEASSYSSCTSMYHNEPHQYPSQPQRPHTTPSMSVTQNRNSSHHLFVNLQKKSKISKEQQRPLQYECNPSFAGQLCPLHQISRQSVLSLPEKTATTLQPTSFRASQQLSIVNDSNGVDSTVGGMFDNDKLIESVCRHDSECRNCQVCSQKESLIEFSQHGPQHLRPQSGVFGGRFSNSSISPSSTHSIASRSACLGTFQRIFKSFLICKWQKHSAEQHRCDSLQHHHCSSGLPRADIVNHQHNQNVSSCELCIALPASHCASTTISNRNNSNNNNVEKIFRKSIHQQQQQPSALQSNRHHHQHHHHHSGNVIRCYRARNIPVTHERHTSIPTLASLSNDAVRANGCLNVLHPPPESLFAAKSSESLYKNRTLSVSNHKCSVQPLQATSTRSQTLQNGRKFLHNLHLPHPHLPHHHSHPHHHPSAGTNFDQARIISMRRIKVLKMLIAIITAFALCWLPIQIFQLMLYFGPNIFLKSSTTPEFAGMYFLCHWISMAHSFMNPIIYSFMSKSFKDDMHNLFANCRWRKKKNPSRHLFSAFRGSPCFGLSSGGGARGDGGLGDEMGQFSGKKNPEMEIYQNDPSLPDEFQNEPDDEDEEDDDVEEEEEEEGNDEKTRRIQDKQDKHVSRDGMIEVSINGLHDCSALLYVREYNSDDDENQEDTPTKRRNTEPCDTLANIGQSYVSIEHHSR